MSDLSQALAALAERQEMIPGLIAQLDQAEAELLHETLPGRERERDALLVELRELRTELTT